MAKKYYSVNTEKKIVTIDDSVKATATDREDIQMYLSVGYKINHKSKVKADLAKKRANKNQLYDADIQKALEKDPVNLNKYLEIKKGKGKGSGFFSAKKWYLENCVK